MQRSRNLFALVAAGSDTHGDGNQMPPAVTGLATTVVKGTRLRPVSEVELESGGARGDRRFYLIDERGRMVNGTVGRAWRGDRAGQDPHRGSGRPDAVIRESARLGE
jgi:hypothetical protein